MKRVLITGGSGTVGRAFIETYYERYQFISYSRNEKKQAALKSRFDKIELLMGSVEDRSDVINAFMKIKPDIVIHAAALKHIEIAEKQPAQAVKTNLFGSLNVIEASRNADVSITLGISSDKACLSNSVYGYTKSLMERIFLEADTKKNRFLCCRLGNVAGSVDSVIPFWFKMHNEKKPLPITDPKMNRFMLSPRECAFLAHKAIEIADSGQSGCVLLKKIKAVNMLDLAKHISSNIQIVGKRLGENLNETLVSEKELPFTYLDGRYVMIKTQKNPSGENQLQEKLTSLYAEKMDKIEISNLIANSISLY